MENCWDEPGEKCWDEPTQECHDEPVSVKDVQAKEECVTELVNQCKKRLKKICH